MKLETILRSGMSTVKSFDEYETDIKDVDWAEAMFAFGKQHSGSVSAKDLIDFDESLRGIAEDYKMMHHVFILESGKILTVGPGYDTKKSGYIGYVGNIDDLDVKGEYEVIINE